MNSNELDPMAQGSANDQPNNQDQDNQWDDNNNNGNNVVVSGFQNPENNKKDKKEEENKKESNKKDIRSETKPPVTEKNENSGAEKEYDDTDHPHEYNTPKA